MRNELKINDVNMIFLFMVLMIIIVEFVIGLMIIFEVFFKY